MDGYQITRLYSFRCPSCGYAETTNTPGDMLEREHGKPSGGACAVRELVRVWKPPAVKFKGTGFTKRGIA